MSRFFRRNVRSALSAFVFLCWSVAPGPLLHAQPTDAPALPPLRQPRRPLIDVQHIALDLGFDFSKRQAYGTADITFSPLQPCTEVAFDAAFLSIESVSLPEGTAAGRPLRYTYDGGDGDDNLRIALARACAPGETLTVRIAYRTQYHNDSDPNNLWGSYGKGLRFFSPTATEPRKRRQVWSMGEPQGNRYWFPGWDAPGDVRTCELRLTAPKPLTVVAVGTLLSAHDSQDGAFTTFHWKMDTPHENYRTAFVMGEYVDIAQSETCAPIHSFCYPDERDATSATTVRVADMLCFFENATGVKYPYPAYNQVFVQDFPWGGGHHTGLATISENMVDDYGTHADFFYLWDGVEAQDLAAQWFSNLLRPADWADAWLAQSFPIYFDCLYSEHKNGRDEMQLWNRQYQIGTCLADRQAGIFRPVSTPHYNDPAELCFDNFGLRGALVLHTLRMELGEEKWNKAIRLYVRENAGKAVGTADFQRAVEAAAEAPMDWFFDQWVYRTGHPVFEVTKSYDRKNGRLTLEVKQTQEKDPRCPYPQAGYFQGKMAVEIDDRVEQIRLEPRAVNHFEFAVPREPQLVNFDFESAWFKEMKFTKTMAELLYQFQHSRDALARRSAMLELASVFKNDQTSAADKAKITAAFRNVITGAGYWRIRNSALLTLQGMGAPDAKTRSMLLELIQRETAWVRAAAIAFLGDARDPKYADLYIARLNDESDRVVNAAAIALGKSKSAKALDVLLRLPNKPSWKNQSLISALNGLRELGDPKGAGPALTALRDSSAAPRWTLATSVWDFRLAAAETLVALGEGNKGYPIVYQRFMRSLEENDLNDIFSNVLLLVTLADARAQEIFPALRERFKGNANALQALENYAAQLADALNK